MDKTEITDAELREAFSPVEKKAIKPEPKVKKKSNKNTIVITNNIIVFRK